MVHLFFNSLHLPLHIISDLLSISFRAWRKFRIGCWSFCAPLPQLRHPMSSVDLLTSSMLGSTRKTTVSNLGCKEGVEPLTSRFVMASWVCALQCALVLWCKWNVFLFGLILRIRWLNDRKFAQYLSEFAVDPVVGNFVYCTPLASQKRWACVFLRMEQFLISLRAENLDEDICWIAFCFPCHNDEPTIRLQW